MGAAWRATSASLLLVVVLLLVGAAPTVTADHAYSHRYVVSGRVLDALGEPIAGIEVEVELFNVDPQGSGFSGVCSYTPESKLDTTNSFIMRLYTNATGDYFACYHIHVVPGPSTVFVRLGPLSKTLGMDVERRQSFANFRLEDASDHKSASGVEHFRCSYDVLGKVYRPQPGATVEGVSVAGVAVTGTAVRVRLSGTGVNLSTAVSTNPYGDFLAGFHAQSLCSPPSNLRVFVSHDGTLTQTLEADRAFRISQLTINEKATPRDPPTLPGLPGGADTQQVLLVVAALAGIVATIAIAYVVTQRRSAAARSMSLRNISGIGGGTFGKLNAAGIDDLRDLAGADPEALAKRTGLKAKTTRRFVQQAQELLESESR